MGSTFESKCCGVEAFISCRFSDYDVIVFPLRCNRETFTS